MTASPLMELTRKEDVTHSAQPVRLAYLVSHPIQYQAPLLRRIAQEPGIDLTVFYGSDFSLRGYRDEGFGVNVQWDQPLLEGYRSELLPSLRDTGTEGPFTPISHGLFSRLKGLHGSPRFNVLWVHGYATFNQMQGILAARLLNIPVLIRSDSTLRDRPRGAFKRLVRRSFFVVLSVLVQGVLVSGTWNREYWRQTLGPSVPLFLLPYAVDNSWFQQRSAQASVTNTQLRTELALESNRPVILFASKLQQRKHCDDLIAAYAALLASGALMHEPYLLIVGDGDERTALQRQAAHLPGVRFCGFRNQSELPRFFALANVFVLPSRHEPWGLIVNEVMNAGCPVIVSDDVGCHPDLITNGVEGFVYPVRDIAALTEALHKVLSSTHTQREMGQAALRRVSGWSFEQDIDGLKQALAHLTGAKQKDEEHLA